MMKLSSGKEVCPFPRVVGTEYVKIGFNLLIGSFCLSIHLEVICSGEFDIIAKKSSKFSGKGRSKLGAFVRYQGVVEAKSFEHMVEEKFGNPCGVYDLGTRDENYPLYKAMVDHDH